MVRFYTGFVLCVNEILRFTERLDMTATINSSVTIHRGSVFRLVSENVTLPNGVTVDLDIIRHPGAAAIVALAPENSVKMIRQFRHAASGRIWEIPAGTFDDGESPLACAKRELVEEAGVSAAAWRKLGEITPVPGYSDERIHLFLATELTPTVQNLDRDELLDVHDIKLAEALEMIHRGEIQDAKTISGLFLVDRLMRNRRVSNS